MTGYGEKPRGRWSGKSSRGRMGRADEEDEERGVSPVEALLGALPPP